MKAAESGLFYTKREVDGVEVTAFRIFIVEECAGGNEGVHGALERKISIENRFFQRDF